MDSYPYHQQQNQPPPPASYYNHVPPPPPPHPQQPYNYPYPQPFNYPPPPPHPQQYPPPPPPPLHHSQYPPHPHPHSHFPPPHPPPPGAPTAFSHPPPPDQWGNASWPQHPGWEYSERNGLYNNKEDWASKAKEWATTNVGTETLHAHSHSAPVDDNRYTYHNQFQPPNQHFSSQQLHAADPLNQASYTHDVGSYATGYNAGDETIKSKANDIAPPQKNYGSTASVYEQEVSYSYSSAPGNQESMHQTQSSHVPMPVHFPVVQESYHSQSLPLPVVAGEQPHFSNHGPTSFIPDACDRPLDFVNAHKPEHASTPSSIHTWPTQLPLGPAAPFDPAYIPQASIPMHAPNFQPSIPPVGVPSSYAFNADLNANIGFSERPKKATVPNWLREEIIKSKPLIPSTTSTLPAGNSLNSVGSEDYDNSIRRVYQGDSKSIDSTKSTEDEDDDEEDVETAKTAALNQEIKRVLTEILLKVTDELFDEIATKVLDEEEETIAVGEGSNTYGNHKASVPTTSFTQKVSAEVLIPYKLVSSKADNGEENTSTSSPGGNLLGLATYASDDEDEIRSSKLDSSENKGNAYHHQESKHDNKQIEDGLDNGSAVRKANNVEKTTVSFVENLNHIEKASVAKVMIEGNTEKIDELFTKDYQDRELKKDFKSSNNSQNRGDKNSNIEKISRETSLASDSVTQVDKNRPKEKSDKDKLKKKEDDKKSERRSNMKDSGFRQSSRHSSNKDDRVDTTKDKRDKYEDGERKRERVKDDKEDQSKKAKDSAKYNHRRSLSPSSRGKNSKDKSFSRNSASGDEPSDNSRKRSKHSHNSSLSPSPSRSQKRQNSRSPHSRHSHRRHSPYSSADRRRR